MVTAPPVPLRRFIRVRNITDADVTELHSEILSVFDATDIITPDQLRGNASSLKEALIDSGGRCAYCSLALRQAVSESGHCLPMHTFHRPSSDSC